MASMQVKENRVNFYIDKMVIRMIDRIKIFSAPFQG